MLWPRLHQRNQSSPGATHPPQPQPEPHHSPQPPFSRGAVIYKLRKVARLPERTDHHLPPSSPPSSSLTPFLYIRALSFYSFYYISISLSSVCVVVCGGVCLRCRSAADQGPGRLSPFSSVAGHRPPGASWLPVRTSVCVCLCEPSGAVRGWHAAPPPCPFSVPGATLWLRASRWECLLVLESSFQDLGILAEPRVVVPCSLSPSCFP